MPLPKHTVQPVRISQVSVPVDVDNELEYVANATLCNLMRQLASISQLATNMFEELTTELSNLAERTMRLQNRLATLQADVQSMQAGDEDLTANAPPVQLAPFSSKKPADSRVLSRHTIPPSMRACYDRADAPPPLEQMDELRDDSRVSMKLYSDPDFFFDLWSQKMLQDPRLKSARKKGAKAKTKTPASKNATSKPQMVIQQTGVGGNYIPEQSAPNQTAASILKQQIDATANNYAAKPTPSQFQQKVQRNVEHILPPPPPPPILAQTSVCPSSSPYQPPVISNGIPPEIPMQNALHRQPAPLHPVQQVNGHPNIPTQQIHPSDPIQHPPPPPLPLNLTPNNIDGHVFTPPKGYPSPPMDLNAVNSLDEIRFPIPPPAFSQETQRVGANSPGNASVSSHDLPPPPAPIFDSLGDEDNVVQGRGRMINPINHTAEVNSNGPTLPPPPPPPPPFLMFDSSNTNANNSLANQMGQLNLDQKGSQPKVPSGPPQDLLSAIRAGCTLRKVSERTTPLKVTKDKFSRNNSVVSLGSKPNDVQAIYEAVRRRRECMENASTDDENTESSDWDD